MNANRLKDSMKIVARNARNGLTRAYMRACFALRPIEKKIVFMSFLGKQYSDNPRAISEKMHALYPDFEQVWVMEGQRDWSGIVPDYVRIVRPGLQRYREIATAFCYVTNTNHDPDLTKRKGQFFVQTWHGDIAFKKILYDNVRGRTKVVPVMDSEYTDVCMAGSTSGEKLFRSAFHYRGEIMSVGCARNDRLLCPNGDEASAIRKKLSIAPEQKVLLYAPTFRKKNQNNQAVNVDLEEVLRHLKARDGHDWVCLLRAHPFAHFRAGQNGDGMQDVSAYPDIADLLMISDFLITDYSSCAPDFVLTRRPAIMATFDREEYSHDERELYVPLEETGFILADDQEQLIDIIDRYTEADYGASCENVLRFYGSKETGHAAESICRRINDQYQGLLKGK